MNVLKTLLLLTAMSALFAVVGALIAGWNGAIIALIIATGMNVFAFWNSDKVVLRMQGAEPLTQAGAPQLYAMVAALVRNADLPMPKLYVIQNDQPNAFATGRNPENAAVAVTSGILKTLNSDELAGVIAHELAHIKNRDTLIMTLAATMAAAISMLSQFWFFFGGNRNSDRGPLGPILVILTAILAPMAAMLIRSSISRTREYSADRLGAEISNDPMALANALRKISGFIDHQHAESRLSTTPATAHMFIINPLSGENMRHLFSTHPPVQRRIEELTSLAEEMRLSTPQRSSSIPTVPRQRNFR